VRQVGTVALLARYPVKTTRRFCRIDGPSEWRAVLDEAAAVESRRRGAVWRGRRESPVHLLTLASERELVLGVQASIVHGGPCDPARRPPALTAVKKQVRRTSRPDLCSLH
jgi:hypothetical protein